MYAVHSGAYMASSTCPSATAGQSTRGGVFAHRHLDDGAVERVDQQVFVQDRLSRQHPADHGGHPVVLSGVVNRRRCQRRGQLTAAQRGHRFAEDSRGELAAAPGLAPPVQHLDLQLPLPIGLGDHGSRSDCVTAGIVGDGRGGGTPLRTGACVLLAVTATPARPGHRYAEYSGMAVGSIQAESGMRSQFGGQSAGTAYAGPTAQGATTIPHAAINAATIIRIDHHP